MTDIDLTDANLKGVKTEGVIGYRYMAGHSAENRSRAYSIYGQRWKQ
jgi:hypothetical protein